LGPYLGYAINFSRYFYQYEQPESAEDLKKEIAGLEKEIQALMGELF
jgi:type I restriction enzyme M protein